MPKRNLYLTNLGVEDALERFQAMLAPHLHSKHETVHAANALGRVTAEAVYAIYNSPLRDSAAMDGVAVVSSHTRGASESSPLVLAQNIDFQLVDTGDPVNSPYDAVIMAEDVHEQDSETIIIRSAAAPWQHVRPVGEDIVQGEMLLPGGHVIRPFDIGALLAGGITKILVRKSPTVAIIPTGTEMVEPGSPMKADGIIESNSSMFCALVGQGGGIPTRFNTVPDDYETIKEQIRDAADRYDMVLVSAGTSAGREDYTVHILRELGQVAVHGVAMKPGKPVILSMVNGKPVIGIPGYPVSAYLAYSVFAAPVLASLAGIAGTDAPIVKAVMTRRLVSSLKYREYVRVKVGRVSNRLVASPLARGAGAAMSLVKADGFCIIEQDSEGIEAGSQANIVLCRDLGDLEHTVVSVGSHDLILDVIADLLPNLHHGVHLSSTHVGSMGGLLALKNDEAHIAPTHLLDEETGIYNIPILKQLFPDKPMALIKGVGRVQGIMVKKGNPLHITGIADLPLHRYVNRQRGAGTRVLIDYLLKKANIRPSDIQGYEREAATHMAVAAAIKGNAADAGMGVLSAAKAMDLDFLPIGNEAYDFAIPVEFLELTQIKAFINVLSNPLFLRKLIELEGYETGQCGEIIILER